MDDLAIRVQAKTRMTFVDFAAFYGSRPDRERWELIDGNAIMMPKPTVKHQRIASNIGRGLHETLLRVRPEWSADFAVAVHAPADHDWAPQPDITVSDTEIQPDQIYAQRFYFVVEVLSSDRPDVLALKRAYYKSHVHIRGFMFVSQKTIAVELVRRTPDGWITDTLTDPDATVDLPDIGVIGRLGQFYRTTELELK